MKIFAVISLFYLCQGFFDVKSLYEKYEFYYNMSDFLHNTAVAVKPIARLTIGATSPISKNSIVLQVPASHIITSFDSFSTSPYVQGRSPELIAAALAISCKMENSTYSANFFHQFPCDIDAPATWLIDDLIVFITKFLEYPETIEASLPYYEEFKSIGVTVEGLKSLAYDKTNYAWAQAFVNTYGIPITRKDWKILHAKNVEEGDDKERGYAFVPLFELFNQVLVPDTHYSDKYPMEFRAGEFVLRANRDFEIGQEVYMPMKKRDNHQLLMDSGINIPHNSNDRLKVTGKDNSIYYLSPTHINNELLSSFTSDPLIKYRQSVREAIVKFKHALRHQKRRLRILDERHIRHIFNLCISEKITAYHSLTLIDRAFLKSLTKKLHLTNV